MDPRKTIVRDAYDRIAGRYLDWSEHSKVRERQLNALLALLAPDANVLELGCGAGVPVTAALAARGPVTAVDISREQVARAKAAAPSATVLCADMTEIDFPPGSFDAVCAFWALTHLPRESHAEMLTRIARWLKPGGIFFATMGATDHPDGIAPDWLGAPNFFSHFDAKTNLALLRGAGFAITRAETMLQDLPGEEHVHFLWVLARREV